MSARLPIVYHEQYRMDIGEHVFPTDKYALTLACLQELGYADPKHLLRPAPASHAQLRMVHSEALLHDFENLAWTPRTMFSELPLTREIVEALILCAGGSILAARTALDQGLCLHIGGGFHHAFADHAEGFCYINDIAVAIRAMQSEKRIQRAAVIDVDLHQGNGTAHIFEHDPNVFTFSIHQEWLYPEKQRSSLDVGLPQYAGDAEYLAALARIVPDAIKPHRPELVVYVAGADPFEEDVLGDLKLTLDGLARRDRLVAEVCHEHGWPMATVLAGGYARDKHDTAEIHATTGVEMATAWGIKPSTSH